MSKAASITMPEQYWKRLNQHSEETGLTTSDIIRRSLDLYFEYKNLKEKKVDEKNNTNKIINK